MVCLCHMLLQTLLRSLVQPGLTPRPLGGVVGESPLPSLCPNSRVGWLLPASEGSYRGLQEEPA